MLGRSEHCGGLPRPCHDDMSDRAAWVRSSAEEHYLDTVGVTGSIPVAPTSKTSNKPTFFRAFSDQLPASSDLNKPRTVPNCAERMGNSRAESSHKVLDGPPPDPKSQSPAIWENHGAQKNDQLAGLIGTENKSAARHKQDRATNKQPTFYVLRDEWARQVRADRKLPHAAARVLWAIADHLNRNTFTAWPSTRTLDKETGMPRRSVLRALKDAERLGHVEIERGFREHGHRAKNVYRPIIRSRVAHAMTPG